MKETLSLRVLRWLLYASALTPLIIFSQFMSPFHFGKVIVFRILVEIALVLYLIVIWQYPAYRPRFNIIHWSFLAFTCAFLLTTITSSNFSLSFWGTLERMGGAWTFIHYFIFYVILTSILRTKREWITLLNITIAAAVVSAFYGFGQKTDIKFFIGSGNRARIFGTIGNAALFAGYQLLALFMSLTLYLAPDTDKGLKPWYLVAAVILAIAVLMTVVRGSLLALAVGLFLFVVLKAWQTKSKLARRLVFTLILLGALFLFFAFSFHDTQFVQKSSFLSRITDVSSDSFTVKTRFWAWQAGLKGWRENVKTILLGWGPESFNYPFAKYFNPQFFKGLGSETLFDRAHNMFIEVLVTMGLIGFLAYLSIFASSLRSLWRKMREKTHDQIYAIGLFCLVVVYAIHNSFIFDTSPNFVVFFSILGFISFLTFPQAEVTQARPNSLSGGKKLLVAILGIVVLVVIYDTNLNAAKANYTTTRAIIASWNGDFNGSVTKYREAIGYEVAGKYEYRHRYAQYVLEYTISRKVTPDLKGVLEDAVSQVQKNVEENPKDYLPYLYMSRLYITLGRDDPKSEYNDKALEYSMKALDISPTFVRTYYEIGQAYLNKKDFNKASEYFQKAAELNPDVGLSLWYYAVVEFEKGNYDKGNQLIDQALQKDYSPTEADYNRLVTAYAKRNDYPRLVKVYEALVKLNPNDPQYYASLAVSYARIGKIEEAVAAARKAAQIDPSFEAEARSFVSSLGKKW